MKTEGRGVVIVFDFDKTIIDVDSDNWVVDCLGFTDLFNFLLPTMPWNSVMDRVMREMHEQGVKIDDIVEALRTVPIHPRVIPAIKTAYDAGSDLRVVSDANRFFIETILSHLGLLSYFSEINTNPGFVDEQGRLRITPFHDFTKSPHGCNGVCPPNMCKGFLIERMLSHEPENRFIYIGDGSGDYCPSLKLRGGDAVMPRKSYPLWELISSDPILVTAQVHEWTDGEELEKTLLCLIDACPVDSISSSPPPSSSPSDAEEEGAELAASGDAQLLAAVDRCNFGSIPLGSHETLPQALPVPH